MKATENTTAGRGSNPPARHGNAQAAARLYGRQSFGLARCAGCGIELQRCYLAPCGGRELCRVCRGEEGPARP